MTFSVGFNGLFAAGASLSEQRGRPSQRAKRWLKARSIFVRQSANCSCVGTHFRFAVSPIVCLMLAMSIWVLFSVRFGVIWFTASKSDLQSVMA